MCEPTTIAVIAGITSAAGVVANNQAVSAQVRAVNQQNALRAEEISRAAGQQLSENAKAAYRERAAMRAAAAESGINLGSGSFLAALQSQAMSQYNEQGLIIHNERAQQRARQTEAESSVAHLQKDSLLSGALKVAGSAAMAYAGAGGKMPSFGGTNRVLASGARLPSSLTIPTPGRMNA